MSEEKMDEDLDLTKELWPLAYYIFCDKKKALMEAFKSLKGYKLEAMMPAFLKSWDRPKLESACLNILENLDDDTLLAVIEGRHEASHESNDSPVKPSSASTSEEDLRHIINRKHKNKILALKDDEFVEVKSKSETESDSDEPKRKRKKKEKTKVKKLKRKLAKAKKKAKRRSSAPSSEPVSERGGTRSAGPVIMTPHQSLMELLELEYKTKAIHAYLKKQGQLMVPNIPFNFYEFEEKENETDKRKRFPKAPRFSKKHLPTSSKSVSSSNSNVPATLETGNTTGQNKDDDDKLCVPLSPDKATDKDNSKSTGPSKALPLVAPIPAKFRRKRKRLKSGIWKEQKDDILDLHPPELSLSNEDSSDQTSSSSEEGEISNSEDENEDKQSLNKTEEVNNQPPPKESGVDVDSPNQVHVEDDEVFHANKEETLEESQVQTEVVISDGVKKVGDGGAAEDAGEDIEEEDEEADLWGDTIGGSGSD